MRPICILFVTITLLSANTSLAGEGDFQLRHSLKLTWAPTSLFDPWGSQVMLGAEYGLSNDISVSAGVGIPLLFNSNSSFIKDQYLQYSKDLKTRLELRCYVYQSAKSRLFIGLEGFYRSQRYKIEKSSYILNVTQYQYDRISFGSAVAEKDMYGVGLLFGGRVRMSERFWFEFYAGMGIKTADVIYSDVQNASLQRANKLYTDFSLAYTDDFNREGNIVSPHIPVGMKLVYLLHRGKK